MPSLTKAQLRGIEKLGNALCPGNEVLPSFTHSGVLAQADRCYGYLTDDDQRGLGMLLWLLGMLPSFCSRVLISVVDTANSWPSFIAPVLRLLQVGLKGFVYSLYYSDTRVRTLLGWQTGINGLAQ